MGIDVLGESNNWLLDGGEIEKLGGGCGGMMPVRLGDLHIRFPAMTDGSWRG